MVESRFSRSCSSMLSADGIILVNGTICFYVLEEVIF